MSIIYEQTSFKLVTMQLFYLPIPTQEMIRASSVDT